MFYKEYLNSVKKRINDALSDDRFIKISIVVYFVALLLSPFLFYLGLTASVAFFQFFYQQIVILKYLAHTFLVLLLLVGYSIILRVIIRYQIGIIQSHGQLIHLKVWEFAHFNLLKNAISMETDQHGRRWTSRICSMVELPTSILFQSSPSKESHYSWKLVEQSLLVLF